MSMFHELMMRKKEEIMYATIKGSLTENDGVFSGFSSSNYLSIPKIDNFANVNSEICIKYSWNDTVSARLLLFGTNSTNVNIRFSSNGNIQVNSEGTTYSVSSYKAYDYTYIKVKNIISNPTIYVSNDGVNWIECNYSTTANSIVFSNDDINITNVNFTGSIDLPNSYIKLGSTKYNLQAVVGYTVVGSPTITDGVVSGFSDSNYLKLGGTIKYSGTSNLEFYFRFKTATTMSGFTSVLSQGYSVGSAYKWRTIAQFGTTSTCNVGYGISSGSVEFYKALQPDTWYRVKFYAKNGVWVNETYNDDGTLFGSANKNFDFAEIERDFYIGANQANQSVFIQAVDLNNSYIKVNNKLWFNGQQA